MISKKNNLQVISRPPQSSDLTVEQISTKTVYIHTTDSQENELSLLVFDLFRAHITDVVKKKLQENNNDLVVISGRLTFMTNGRSGKTKKENLKCAKLHIVYRSEDSEIYHDKILDNKTNEANKNNPDIDSGDSNENEEDFEDKENDNAMIKENED
ncbi:4883_t:CDS:2, partial [Scutellospora calospora]